MIRITIQENKKGGSMFSYDVYFYPTGKSNISSAAVKNIDLPEVVDAIVASGANVTVIDNTNDTWRDACSGEWVTEGWIKGAVTMLAG